MPRRYLSYFCLHYLMFWTIYFALFALSCFCGQFVLFDIIFWGYFWLFGLFCTIWAFLADFVYFCYLCYLLNFLLFGLFGYIWCISALCLGILCCVRSGPLDVTGCDISTYYDIMIYILMLLCYKQTESDNWRVTLNAPPAGWEHNNNNNNTNIYDAHIVKH